MNESIERINQILSYTKSETEAAHDRMISLKADRDASVEAKKEARSQFAAASNLRTAAISYAQHFAGK